MGKEYWDSCLFICYLQNKSDEQDSVDTIDALLKKAERGETLIVVSALVLAEVRPRSTYDEERYKVIRELFYTNRPYVRVVAITPPIADNAASIGGAFRALTVPDTVHIATAMAERVDVLFTFDGKKDTEKRRSGEVLFYNGKIGVPPLRIELPTLPDKTQIPMKLTLQTSPTALASPPSPSSPTS